MFTKHGFIHPLKVFLLCVFTELASKETIEIKSRLAAKTHILESFVDVSILILNKMVDAVNEMTSESDINQIYESIAEFMRYNKEEPENRHLQELLKKLSVKIKEIAFRRTDRIKILSNFHKFCLRMTIDWSGNIKVAHFN